MGIGVSLKFDQNKHDQVSFLAPGPTIGFDVNPKEALEYFKSKGLKATFAWQEMLAEEHDKAFTVAKMMDLDILAEVRSRVDIAISQGKSRQWFAEELEPILQRAGWWGRRAVTDPGTGQEVVAQLGSVRRLELIYRTNLQTSYGIGHWSQTQATKDAAPWLMYDAVDDSRTRPEHARLDGKVLPADSPFWKTHYPPNGWNCRCGTIQMTDAELAEFGLTPSKEPKLKYRNWKNPKTGKIRKVPTDLDPGWDYNPGLSWHEQAQATLAEKIGTMHPDMAKKAMEGLAASQKAKDAYRSQLAAQAAQKTLAKEQGILEQAKSVARAQQRAAQAQLDAIASVKTKYKYAALKQLKKTKAGASMSPKDLLAAVEAKAKAAQTSAALAHYKQSAIKGKKPSAAASKAFDSLPEEAQKSMLADIEAKSVIVQQQKAAAATLKDIQDNPAGQKLKQKALIEELQGKPLGDVSDPVALLAKVEGKAAAVQAKASQSAALSGYKAKVLEGKIPTAGQKKAFDGLAPDEQKAFLAKVDTAKAEVDEFKTLYEGAYASAPNANEVKGFIKAKVKTKSDTLAFLKKKQPTAAPAPATADILAGKQKAPGLTEAPGAAQWAPAMKNADAKKWAKDSAIKTPASHFTSPAASKSIKAGGFELKHAGTGGGDVFGEAVYLVPDPKGAGKASADFYKGFAGPSEVKTYVNVQKVKTIYADEISMGKIYYQGKPVTANIPDPHVSGMQQALLSGVDDAGKKYAAALEATKSSENFFVGNKGAAVQKVLKDEGYDAVRIVNKQFNEGVGGDQLIVFDPKKVVVVNPKAKKVAAAAPPKPAPKAETVKVMKDYDELTVEEKYNVAYKAGGVESAFGDDAPWPSPFSAEWKKAGKAKKKIILKDLEDTGLEVLDDLYDEQVYLTMKMLAEEGKDWLYKTEAVKTFDAPKIAAVKAAGEVEDWTKRKLTQTGNQKGSNKGGFYQDTETGEKWYIKTPANEDIARNEVLAAKLYQATGVEVPDLHLVNTGDGVSIASRIVDGISENIDAVSRGTLKGQNDGFAVDAWLANWDVTGLGFDNLVVKGKQAIRIDVGGSLRYRAQGSSKGAAFGKVVDEIESLRDAATNPQSAAAFAKVKKADIEAGVARIAAVTDDEITRLVDEWGPRSAAERATLAETLIARRDDLIKRYPAAAKAKPVPAVTTKRGVTTAEAAAIKESRVNGLAVRSDLDDIEDQQIVFSEFVKGRGEEYTKAYLKIRPEAGARLQKTTLTGEAGKVLAKADTNGAADIIQNLVIGVNKQLDLGKKKLRKTDIERLSEAKWQIAEAKKDLDNVIAAGKGADRATALELKLELNKWEELVGRLDEAHRNGDEFERFPLFEYGKVSGKVSVIEKTADARRWTERAGATYTANEFDRSKARALFKEYEIPSVNKSLVLEEDGMVAKYIPYRAENSFSTEGMMLVEVKGTGKAAVDKILKLVEDAGINPDRPSVTIQRELYLDKLMYIRTTEKGMIWDRYTGLKTITDPEERLQAKLTMVNAETKMDVSKSKGWASPDGESQAFGHGRKILKRPDLDGPEFDDFAEKHTLYHNPTGLSASGTRKEGTWDVIKTVINGGGQFAPQVDRVRRGIPIEGSSVYSDLETGGGQYFFTRIQKRDQAPHTGLFFSPEHIKRMDAVTYPEDKYGEVKPHLIRSGMRKITVRDFNGVAGKPGNETIFKDSMSVFDGLEKITLWDRAEKLQAIRDLKAWGYERWPDGRALEDVIDTVK